MHTRGAETEAGGETSLGAAAKQVAEHASTLARLEIELAKLELTRKVTALGKGIAFALVAAILLLFMLGFLASAGAAALATTMSTWLALLIVAAALLAAAGLLGLLALNAFKRGTPPVPEQAIREAKLTTDALKADGSS
ncbi:MAG TPA: phage holin family protein [Gaiellaceae bacterium]